MYSDIIEKLDFDRKKYVISGYFIRKIRPDGLYEPITDVYRFVSNSIFRQDWRRRVLLEKKAICSLCDKMLVDKDDITVLYKGGYRKILTERNITTIDQALKVQILWDVDQGEIRCRKHSKNSGTKKLVYEPTEEDKKYIDDWKALHTLEELALLLKVPAPLLKTYCDKECIKLKVL